MSFNLATYTLVHVVISLVGIAGAWRATYVISAVAALYFNCFVLVVQSFLKVPALNALAPTQSEPPFLVAQLVVLALFLLLGTLAVRRSKGI